MKINLLFHSFCRHWRRKLNHSRKQSKINFLSSYYLPWLHSGQPYLWSVLANCYLLLRKSCSVFSSMSLPVLTSSIVPKILIGYDCCFGKKKRFFFFCFLGFSPFPFVCVCAFLPPMHFHELS